MSNSRALRYRKLALQEPDKENAQLLQLLADEADRGVLCSVEWTRHSSKTEIPIKSSEGKARTPHICENDLGWFDMRDLGAVLDHEKLLPIGMRSVAIASQDHQRSAVMRQRHCAGQVRTRHGRALMIL